MNTKEVVSKDIKAVDLQETKHRYFYFRKDGEQRLAWISEKGKYEPDHAFDVPDIENHELPDGRFLVYDFPGKWRCRKCGGVFHKTGDSPEVCACCDRASTFDRANPPCIEEPWIPYGEPEVSLQPNEIPQKITDFLRRYLVLPRSEDYTVLTWWIIATYLQHCFWTFSYLQFIAPIRSGKTTALQLLSMLAFNCVDAIAITPSALSRLIERYKCTTLVDQGENKFNLKSERGQEFYDIFMGGYKKGQKHIVSDKEDPNKVIIRHEFGPKAIASTRMFDGALTDRSIVFRLREGIPPKEDITKETIAEAEEIRNTLAGIYLGVDELEELEIDLHGRAREKYAPLIRTCWLFGGDTKMLYKYAGEQEQRERDELMGTPEYMILKTIYEVQHKPLEEYEVTIEHIGNKTRLDNRKIGWVLKDMNIKRKRSNAGVYVSLEDPDVQEELHYLYKKFYIVDKEGNPTFTIDDGVNYTVEHVDEDQTDK